MAELCCAFGDCCVGGANVTGEPLFGRPPTVVSGAAGIVAAERAPLFSFAEGLLVEGALPAG